MDKNTIKKYSGTLNSEVKSKSGIIESIRQKAVTELELIDFPDKKNEEWKYTNIKPLITADYNFFSGTGINAKDIDKFIIPGMNADIAVFINGIFRNDYSKISNGKTNGVLIDSLKTNYDDKKELISKHFGLNTDLKNNIFTTVNTALTNDGILISIPDNYELTKHLYILNIIDSSIANTYVNTRNIIITGKKSSSTIIMQTVFNGRNKGFINEVNEMYAGEDSKINLFKIQTDKNTGSEISLTSVEQDGNSVFNSVTISWGGAFIRNNLNSILKGEGSECHLYGLYICNDDRLVDNHSFVDHFSPNANSNELYKGIIADKSTGVFNGKVLVRKDAQKTNAYQSNKNILLSDTAIIYSKPQLEIFADNVKCSHGAATGQINEEELFYIRSRGISEKEAKSILLTGFASEIIEQIKDDSLKLFLQNSLEEKLREIS